MENSSLLSALVPHTTDVLIITLHYAIVHSKKKISDALLCPSHDFAHWDTFEKDKLPSLIEDVHPAFYREDATTSMIWLCKELRSSLTKET